MNNIRERKRNSNKNRSRWAATSKMRRRPITGHDFDQLKKGAFDWGGEKTSAKKEP